MKSTFLKSGQEIWASTVLPLLAILFLISSCAAPLSQINENNETRDVVIKCVPDDAKVYLDQIYIGKARRFSTAKRPLKVTVGTHVLEFEAKGYQHELREVMTTNEVLEIKLDMKLRPVPEEE